jgi:hypothetical protein
MSNSITVEGLAYILTSFFLMLSRGEQKNRKIKLNKQNLKKKKTEKKTD